jgi:hypothetical protein
MCPYQPRDWINFPIFCLSVTTIFVGKPDTSGPFPTSDSPEQSAAAVLWIPALQALASGVCHTCPDTHEN